MYDDFFRKSTRFENHLCSWMDTAAYLTRQGWRGSGHSLHPSGHGIAKPLLVSKKNDVLGLGNRKNDALASQWWLKAFDTTLKQVNFGAVDGSSKPVVEKAASIFQRPFYNNALYSNFVKGEGLSGTYTPAAEPQARMESVRQINGAGDDGTALESKWKSRDKQRNAELAGGGPSLLVPTIASTGNGTSENEVTRDLRRKPIKIRRAGQVTAPESSREKGIAYLETQPLVNGVEENPRFKRKTKVEPGETRNPKFREDKNSATYENGALDSDPPRKRRQRRKRLNEVGNVEASEIGVEKGLAYATKMESSDREALKDSRPKPKAEEKPGKTEGQERQPAEISEDERDILSKLEEQLSFETMRGQVEQAHSANGQDERKQLGKHQHQLTKQEMAESTKLRKRQNLRRVRQNSKKDSERLSQPKTATLSHVAVDLSEHHRSASGECNRVREPPKKPRILGNNAWQPNPSLPPIPRGPRRKDRKPGDNARQPTLSLPSIANHTSGENMSASAGKNRARKLRRKNRILRDDAGQPTSYLPPAANHDKGTALKKKRKRPSVRSSGKHVDGNARKSKSLSRTAEVVPGEGKPAPPKQKKALRRNEDLFEYDDAPVATPMDAITQFLKSRAEK